MAAPRVLVNDSDGGAVLSAAGTTPALRIVPPADGLTARLVDGPVHGTVELRPDGSFAYVATAGYAGPDRFTYQAADFFETGDVVEVELTVTATATPATGVPVTPRFTG